MLLFHCDNFWLSLSFLCGWSVLCFRVTGTQIWTTTRVGCLQKFITLLFPIITLTEHLSQSSLLACWIWKLKLAYLFSQQRKPKRTNSALILISNFLLLSTSRSSEEELKSRRCLTAKIPSGETLLPWQCGKRTNFCHNLTQQHAFLLFFCCLRFCRLCVVRMRMRTQWYRSQQPLHSQRVHQHDCVRQHTFLHCYAREGQLLREFKSLLHHLCCCRRPSDSFEGLLVPYIWLCWWSKRLFGVQLCRLRAYERQLLPIHCDDWQRFLCGSVFLCSGGCSFGVGSLLNSPFTHTMILQQLQS